MAKDDAVISAKAGINQDALRAAARRRNDIPPAEGSRVEFCSDRHTDKGPCTGTVIGRKVTVDGYYVTFKIGDAQASFSWDDLRDHASKSGDGWMIKAMPQWEKPTPAQAEAGNYFKPRRKWHGLNLAIENPAGTVREGVDETGRHWRTEFKYAYGEITGTEGVDGDPVDVFIGPYGDATEVYIVRQMKRKQWDVYDEDKCFIDFSSIDAAKQAYCGHYDDARFFGGIIAMPIDEFIMKVKETKDKPAMIKAVLLFRSKS